MDLSKLETIDGGAMAILVQAKWDLQSAGVKCDFAGGSVPVRRILALYEGDASPTPKPPRVHVGFFGSVGNATVEAMKEAQLLFGFVGSMVLAVGGVVRRPRTGNWHDMPPIMTRVGADAVPIVVLITFLIGFVMAFQSAVQLKQFGANIYVADLVGLSITRELGPLMVAIIVCGRSGAAFAAELGTMKVSEEIDAMNTMGLKPARFLVVPKIVALTLTVPMLVLVGNVCGIVGGVLVTLAMSDITYLEYMNRTLQTLVPWNILESMVKALAFAVIIAGVGCFRGFEADRDAKGVGSATTSAVVSGIFLVIVADFFVTFFYPQVLKAFGIPY